MVTWHCSSPDHLTRFMLRHWFLVVRACMFRGLTGRQGPVCSMCVQQHALDLRRR